MSYLLPTLTFLIPALGMISGLSASITIPLFLISCLYILKKEVIPASGEIHKKQYSMDSRLREENIFKVSNYKLELAFAAWCLCCCLWALDPLHSLLLYVQLFAVIFIGFIIKNNVALLSPFNLKINAALFLSIGVAFTLFYTEYYSGGIITNSFRSLFQPSSPNIFHLYNLDRGCSILTLAAWIVIGVLANYRRYLIAILVYGEVLYLLSISDSLASFIGFVLGGVIYLLTRLLPFPFFKLIKIGLILGSLLMPLITYNITPQALADNYPFPESAKHRLFIWHFVAEKIAAKPILGYGLGDSKYIETKPEETIEYNGNKWSPLPLHPHNNVLQILLETGIIGVALFLALAWKWLTNIERSTRATTIVNSGVFGARREESKPIDNRRATSNDVTKCQSIDYTPQANFAAISYAAFINYYIIGMISFSIWQLWWVYTGVWAAIMIRWLVSNGAILTAVSDP